MSIFEHIAACEAKYDSICALFTGISHITFDVTGIKYKELADYARAVNKELKEDGDVVRMIAQNDYLNVTIWLYSVPVRIVCTVEIIET